tara:strand:- start:1804 stop:2493 length:690 start_codon:yes stop_codon:yes gene_type:complete
MKMHKNIKKLLKEGIIPSTLPKPNGETINEFIEKDLKWWKEVGSETDTPELRRPLYKLFLDRFNEHTSKDYGSFDREEFKVAEISGGPFGGILDLFFEKVRSRTQIDLLANNFQELKYKTNYQYEWFTCPAERILKDDNTYDFLIGFNSLDHGWDIKAAISECIRVSKTGLINFDVNRHYVKGYPDRSHYQLVEKEDIIQYLNKKHEVRKHWISNIRGKLDRLEFYWEK